MPSNSQLTWFDIDDFTAGIWDSDAAKGHFAAPPKGFRLLTDYKPAKSGGLRPFIKPSAVDLTGVGANETPMGIFARNGCSRPTGVGGTGNDSTDMVLVTMNTTDHKFRIYRLDGTVGSPTWSVRFTSTAGTGNGHQIADFAYFKDINGVEWYLMSIFTSTAGGGGGLYSMRLDFTVASNTGNDGLVAKLQSYNGPICISQARILIGGGNDDKINYSGVGLTTGFGSFLEVAPNRSEANVSIISGVEPSDLVIGKEGAPWVTISGDITSTTTPVREMGNEHHVRQDKQQVPQVPGGIAFIEGHGRVFVTDGRNFNSISDQLGYFPLNINPSMVGAGTMGYGDSLLFANERFGTTNIYDFDAQCWFRASGINAVFSWFDPYSGKMWCANHSDTAPAIVAYDLFAGNPVSSGVIQTVPYADQNGRNVDIREVQMFVDTHALTEFKVELLDENDVSVATRYVTIPANKHDLAIVKFPYSKSNYLSCKITARAVDGSSEAPSFERIRIGFAANNLITAA